MEEEILLNIVRVDGVFHHKTTVSYCTKIMELQLAKDVHSCNNDVLLRAN